MTTPRDIMVMLHQAVTQHFDDKNREGHSTERLLVHDWFIHHQFGCVDYEEIGVVDYSVTTRDGWQRMEITTSDRREFEVVVFEKHPLPRRVT